MISARRCWLRARGPSFSWEAPVMLFWHYRAPVAWQRGVSQNCIIKDSDFPSPVTRRTLWRLEVHSDELRTSIGRIPLKQEEQSRQAALPPCSLAVRCNIRRWEPSGLFTIQSSCIGATCDGSFAKTNAEDLSRS